MQLDLFSHSRDVMLRNDLIDALKSRRTDACEQALKALATEYPDDVTLAPAAHLISTLAAECTPFANHEEATRIITAVEGETQTHAVAVLGVSQALQWLRPIRQAIARAAEHLAYRADLAETHPGSLYLRNDDWAAAEHHTHRIANWRRIPRPLSWAATACFHQYGLDRAWPLLAELAWLDNARFDTLARSLPAPALQRLLKDYEREHTSSFGGTCWFPAWAVVACPELCTVIRDASTPIQSAPEQAFHVAMSLLSLERQGRHKEIIEQRKRLRTLNPELFAFYMQTRD